MSRSVFSYLPPVRVLRPEWDQVNSGQALIAAQDFIVRNSGQIAPTLPPVLFDRTNDCVSRLGVKTCENILRHAASSVLLHNKEVGSFDRDAQHVLLVCSDPGAADVTLPLLVRLLKDRRCCTVSLFADGEGLLRFMRSLEEARATLKNPPLFELVGEDKFPLFARLGQLSSTEPLISEANVAGVPQRALDSIVLGASFLNSPHRSLLFGGKSVLGARGLHVILDGWGNTIVPPPELNTKAESLAELDRIDSVFLNDRVARFLFESAHADTIPVGACYDFGTPQLDALQFDQESLDRARGRLELQTEEVSILYAGMGLTDESRIDKSIPFGTTVLAWEEVVDAALQVQQADPHKKFAVLYRPHPRDGANGISRGLEVLQSRGLEFGEKIGKLRFIDASKNVIDSDSVSAASDAVVAIVSTMMFSHARTRAKNQTAMLALTPAEQGLIAGNYGSRFVDNLMRDDPGCIVQRREDLVKKMLAWGTNGLPSDRTDLASPKILDVILNSALSATQLRQEA